MQLSLGSQSHVSCQCRLDEDRRRYCIPPEIDMLRSVIWEEIDPDFLDGRFP